MKISSKSLATVTCSSVEEAKEVIDNFFGSPFRIFAKDSTTGSCELWDSRMESKTLEDFFVDCEDNLSSIDTTFEFSYN
jgi:hypothetical protein